MDDLLASIAVFSTDNVALRVGSHGSVLGHLTIGFFVLWAVKLTGRAPDEFKSGCSRVDAKSSRPLWRPCWPFGAWVRFPELSHFVLPAVGVKRISIYRTILIALVKVFMTYEQWLELKEELLLTSPLLAQYTEKLSDRVYFHIVCEEDDTYDRHIIAFESALLDRERLRYKSYIYILSPDKKKKQTVLHLLPSRYPPEGAEEMREKAFDCLCNHYGVPSDMPMELIDLAAGY